jgi:adenylate cyclase
MQDRVSDLPPHSGFPLAVRVGLCAGHQSREGRFFPGEGANAAASLSMVAAPGHILFSVPKRAKFFPWSQLASNSMPDLELCCGSRRLGVFQVPWQQRDPRALGLALTELANVAGRLCVRYKGVEIILDESQPVTRIGRQPDCDLSMRDIRCSRDHGRIERRLDCFVFVDCSTNGTFVTLEDQVELRVNRQEIVLFGRGQLSFGAPASAKGVELLQFQTAGFSR